MNWTLSPLNQIEFPTTNINQSSLLHPWNLTSMFLQLDYNAASEKRPNAPYLSLFYTIPLAGKLYPKMNIVGGAYALSVKYDF